MRKFSHKRYGRLWEDRVAPDICDELCRACGPLQSKTEIERPLEGTVAQVPQQFVCGLEDMCTNSSVVDIFGYP